MQAPSTLIQIMSTFPFSPLWSVSWDFRPNLDRSLDRPTRLRKMQSSKLQRTQLGRQHSAQQNVCAVKQILRVSPQVAPPSTQERVKVVDARPTEVIHILSFLIHLRQNKFWDFCSCHLIISSLFRERDYPREKGRCEKCLTLQLDSAEREGQEFVQIITGFGSQELV